MTFPKKDVWLAARNAAEEYLKERGFEVLARDWKIARSKPGDPSWRGKNTSGKIALIVRNRGILVAVKLKLPFAINYTMPLPAVHPAERATLRGLTTEWAAAHRVGFDDIRIDVLILRQSDDGQFTIEHVQGVR